MKDIEKNRQRRLNRYVVAIASLPIALIAMTLIASCVETMQSGPLGTTTQAVITPNPSQNLMFPGKIKISGTEQELQLGGYYASGQGSVVAGIYDATAATWTPLVDSNGNLSPLPVALGEVDIALLAANTYLVGGGRAQQDGPASTFTRILTLSGAGGNTATWVTPGQMVQASAGSGGIFQCGTGANLIRFGGATDKSMEDMGGTATATDSIQVFAYNSGTPSASVWATLKDNGGSTTVTLSVARAYATVLAKSNNLDFTIGGGFTGSAINGTADRVSVNNNCTLTTSPMSHKTPTGTAPLTAVAKAATITLPTTVTVAGKTYDSMIAGGITTTGDAVTGAACFYSFGSDAYLALTALTTARAFPTIVSEANTTVTVVAGVVNSGGTLLFTSSKKTQKYTIATQGQGAEGNIATEAVGAWVEYLNGAIRRGYGAKFVSGTPTMNTDIE